MEYVYMHAFMSTCMTTIRNTLTSRHPDIRTSKHRDIQTFKLSIAVLEIRMESVMRYEHHLPPVFSGNLRQIRMQT